MTTWKKQKLQNCVTLETGYPFKSASFTNKEDDIHLVKGENVSQGKILWEISKKWNSNEWNKYSKFQLRENDVILAMDRPWVPDGLKWAYVKKESPNALLVQRCSRLRALENIMDQTYLRYVISSKPFQRYIKSIVTGVNVPHVSPGQILNYETIVPTLDTQRSIANTLLQYDELIDNNEKRIEILEEIAQRLYTEWFVKFKFPGHEKIKMAESRTDFTMIPHGWDVVKVEDLLADVKRKTKLQTDQYQLSGKYPIIDQGRDFIAGYTDDETAVHLENLVVFGDHTRCFKFCNFAFTCGADGTQLIKTNDQERMPQVLFYYSLINSELQNFSYARHFKFLKVIDVLLPDSETSKKFDSQVSVYYEEIRVLRLENVNLAKLRDLLISQLVTGKRELKN